MRRIAIPSKPVVVVNCELNPASSFAEEEVVDISSPTIGI